MLASSVSTAVGVNKYKILDYKTFSTGGLISFSDIGMLIIGPSM
jgi:hypothetical protein